MPDMLFDDLKDMIARRQVIVIIGAGVTCAATANPTPAPVASWPGLLLNGAERCEQLNLQLPAKWGERVRDEIKSGDMDDMLSAAEKIQKKLTGAGEGEFSRWLRETVGSLRACHPDVIQALKELGCPLATTNYDSLVEKVTGLSPVTWREGARVERVLRGDEAGVLHIHGSWQDPASVILGIRSYEQVLGDAHAQTIQKAMRTLTSLLFVGCGAGLGDPNLGTLLAWSREVFRGSEYRHYRLCLNQERAQLLEEHPPEERIYLLSYGERHGDLVPFLQSLTPSRSPASAPPSQPAVVAGDGGGFARLPARPRCFGRDAQLSELIAGFLTETPTPRCVLGPPGIGKSNLCLGALHDPHVAERYGRRRSFVRCDAACDRQSLVAEMAKSLGVTLGPGLEDRVLLELERGPAAIVLDNFETPWLGDQHGVEEFLSLLASIGGIALAAAVRGNQQPLGPAWAEPISLTRLDFPPARQAFLAVAGQRFSDDPALDPLLKAQDGLPLAIELLASQAQAEPSLTTLERRWKLKRTELLRRGRGGDRLSNLELSFALSLDSPAMTPAARRLLTLLGVLADGIAHGHLDRLLPGEGDDAASVLRGLGLAYDEAERLRTLGPLREFIARCHRPDPGLLSTAQRVYAGFAAEWGGMVGGESGGVASLLLAAEAWNLEAMVRGALTLPDHALAIRGALGLGEFYRFSGYGSPEILESAAAVARAGGETGEYANCIQRLGDIALERSDHDEAMYRFDDALRLYSRIPEFYSIGWTRIRLARLSEGAERDQHLASARQAWESIGRHDLLESMEEEFSTKG